MQQIVHCHALRLQIPSTGVIECVSGLLLVEIKKMYETVCFRKSLYFPCILQVCRNSFDE